MIELKRHHISILQRDFEYYLVPSEEKPEFVGKATAPNQCVIVIKVDDVLNVVDHSEASSLLPAFIDTYDTCMVIDSETKEEHKCITTLAAVMFWVSVAHTRQDKDLFYFIIETTARLLDQACVVKMNLETVQGIDFKW